MTRYRSFAELAQAETEEVDFRVDSRGGVSGILVMAIHGGGIEPGTSEIAAAVAGRRHGFYAFNGLKAEGNFSLHLTSRRFDEPRGIAMAKAARLVLSIHGCADREPLVLIGGLHPALRKRVQQELEAAGFNVRPSARFPGRSPLNICNRCRLGMGVQLEITAGLRRKMFDGLNRPGRRSTTAVFERFTGALAKALEEEQGEEA
jgi:phage replication-related protein YjqB (UPF0714/DUF867 family)